MPPLKTIEELREGTSTKPGVFRIQAIRAHLRSKKHHGAGDLTGLQMREKMIMLFETDDEELHSLLFKHCMYRWVDSDLDLIAKSRDPIAVLAGLLKVDKDGVGDCLANDLGESSFVGVVEVKGGSAKG